MRVLDFDGTILKGDSSARFVLYCLTRRPRLLRRAPGTALRFALYRLGRIDKTAFKQGLFAFMADVDAPERRIADFWDRNEKHVRAWYRQDVRSDDIIATASPEFLIRPICERLGICQLIASKVDVRTGKFDGKNNSGAEKARRFAEEYPGVTPDEFYSDSLHDAPMARLARRAYLVRGNRIEEWPQ